MTQPEIMIWVGGTFLIWIFFTAFIYDQKKEDLRTSFSASSLLIIPILLIALGYRLLP